jgi:protein Tex
MTKDTVISEKDLQYICQNCATQLFQAVSVIEMLQEGMTVPFISRYRKERTGSLDEAKVNAVADSFQYVSELNERKQTVLTTIEEQGKLTAELRARIEATYAKPELEDIYLPYKPKRRTKATIAKEKGLEPLAVAIFDPAQAQPAAELATPFINAELGVNTLEEALEGAGHIIAEWYSENADLRQLIRRQMADKGAMAVTVSDEWQEKRSKFEQYYKYSEPLRSMPSHRILAIRRGESEDVLKTKVEVDAATIQTMACQFLVPPDHPRRPFLVEVLADALNRLILISLEVDIRGEMKKKADDEAIAVFAKNLENLLLTSPAGSLRVLGVDPGFRTGCKLAALDETGKLLENATIYPTQSEARIADAKKTVADLIGRHQIKVVAIGNGTASRETKAFFKECAPEGVIVAMVSEAGASVYSASEAGREEFPDHDVTVRGAVSIGRRFQDPLAELVKIDPKSIGVGQYQHDVNQSHLQKKLDAVVVSVVNRVGVDINTASYHLLKYVSGIGDALAHSIVSYRNDNGRLRNRKQLLEVKKFGAKAFQQSAGFLRIRDGEEPLDRTGIHPESYSVVERMAQKLQVVSAQLIANHSLVSSLAPTEFVTEEFGLPTLHDILKELESPGRDPRQDFEMVEFNDDVQEIKDVKEDMVLTGVVTNVTRFGAFVDIGVHQDGLVHVSELSHTFVTSPEQVIAVGEKVKVKVLKVDPEVKRISLSIKALQPAPQRQQPMPRARRPENRPEKKPAPPPPPTKEKRIENAVSDLKKLWGSK